MSWTSPLDGAEHDRALAARRRPSPCAARGGRRPSSWSRPTAARTAAASRRWPNSSPTVFMPASRTSLTMLSGAWPSAHGLVEVGLDPVAVAVDDAVLERRSPTGQPDRSSCSTFELSTPSNMSRSIVQRVVAVAPAVVDEVEADLPGLLVDRFIGMIRAACTMAESSPACWHSCRNTEFRTWRIAGLQAERHVRQPEDGPGAGQLRLDPADGLDGLHGVAAEVLLAGAERERERVEDQVGRRDAVLLGREVVDALGDADLPLDVARLALLVDEQADDGRAVVAGERHHAVDALALVLALLEVGRVEDAACRR